MPCNEMNDYIWLCFKRSLNRSSRSLRRQAHVVHRTSLEVLQEVLPFGVPYWSENGRINHLRLFPSSINQSLLRRELIPLPFHFVSSNLLIVTKDAPKNLSPKQIGCSCAYLNVFICMHMCFHLSTCK